MTKGYSPDELDDIQAKWKLRFPPDLIWILRGRRCVIEVPGERNSFDWIRAPENQLRKILDWPFKSFLFDVKQGRWWPEWGEMPIDFSSRTERLQEIFSSAPKLIPVYGHRYLPEEPNESGNPVFSVYQMDVIIYGSNLPHYIAHETNQVSRGVEWPRAKKIKFWTKAVELNGADPYTS